MFNLDRFRDAQDAPHAGFAAALRELQAGRKTGHWIWYVFPQLAGLGRSSTAVQYGLAGAEEAADYLRDRVLGERLVTAAAVVRMHLTNASGGDVEHLDGCAAGEVEPGQGDSPDRLIALGPEIDLAGAEVIDDTPPREVRLRHRGKDLEAAGDRIRVGLVRQHGGAHEPIERRDGRG